MSTPTKWVSVQIDTKFFPLRVGAWYLMQYCRYAYGNPWLGHVESVTDMCYQINGKWYVKSDFEQKYHIYEEVEPTEAGYVTKK